MATYVSVKKVRKFPAVLKAFKRGGAASFDAKVKKAASYSRVTPGTGTGRSNAQIDVTSITGVKALKKNGKG
ncbi:MAG: hypothetical protein ACREXP_26755 [Steroidobacteraceae bacterium]